MKERNAHGPRVLLVWTSSTGPYRTPRIPPFAKRLEASIFRLHSSAYRNPDQLPEGDALVVGAGNSGAEISMELVATRRTYLSGRDTGRVPAGFLRRRLFWWLIDRVTADTKLGRKAREFDRERGTPLVGLKPEDIARVGVERLPRTEGVAGGKPRLADGRVLEVTSVVWATGFDPDFGWIRLPVFDEDGYPVHRRGVVDAAPGLYFVGLPFQHTFASAVVGGVGKDASYVAEHLAGRRSAHPDVKSAGAVMPAGQAGWISTPSWSRSTSWQTTGGKPRTLRADHGRGRQVLISESARSRRSRSSLSGPGGAARLLWRFADGSEVYHVLGTTLTRRQCA